MNSINLPSCLIVSSAEGLRQGPALNDIASLILNTSLPQTIYRENVESEHKVLHNLKTLVKEISTLFSGVKTCYSMIHSERMIF